MSELDRYTEEWRLAVAHAYIAGTPVKEISERFGVSMSYPATLARRCGARLRGAGATWRRRAEGNDPWWWKEACGPTCSPTKMSFDDV